MYVLRLADPADLPAIVGIYNSTIASRQVTADLDPVTTESRLDWFKAHQRVERPIWVAEPSISSSDGVGQASVSRGAHRNSILGWMSLSDFYGRPAYRHTAEISIYCDPSVRRKGLGSFLLASALEFAPTVDVRTMLGFIFGHNQASLELFHKFGFDTWADLPKVAELDDNERDLHILGKRIA